MILRCIIGFLLCCLLEMTIDPSDAAEFQTTYDINYMDSGESVLQTSDGGYVIAGSTGDSSYDVLLMKTDQS